jgi:hypothetical protein
MKDSAIMWEYGADTAAKIKQAMNCLEDTD